MKQNLISLFYVGITLFPALALQAAPASDNASNYSTATWTNGSGFGTGFDPWFLASSAPTGTFAGFVIESSTTGGSGNINSGNGASFGIYANPSGATADAYRHFLNFTPLAVGETFSLQMAVNGNSTGGNKGFDLFSAGAGQIFNLNIGSGTFTVNGAATGNGPLFGNALTAQTIFGLSFTQTSPTGGTWQIVRSGGLSGTAGGTYAGAPTDFHFYVQGADGGSAGNLYFNDLLVAVPEPSTFVMAGLGAAGLLCWSRRRSRIR